jgi:signal transduction histidine kinase
MRWRIRTQLLSPIVLLLAGVALISLGTAWTAARQARRQIEARQQNVARFLVDKAWFPLTREVLSDLEPLSGADYLLDRPGLPRRTSLPIDPDQVRLDVPVADDWQALRLGPPVRVAGRTYLCSGIRLRRGQDAGGILYILYPESLWRDAQWEAIWPSLVLGVFLGAAALALALTQARRLGRRIQELERRTGRIAAGDFSPMPLPAGDDEIRDLARSVNEMAQQLAQFQKNAEQTERLRLLGQVSGGLAHQLRNGLTGARLAVQLFLRESAGGVDAGALEVALRQLTLLETHVRRFLDLGRAGPARREPCDLAALVSEAVDLLRPQCRHAGIALSWQAPAEPCTIEGDAGQLGQLIVNLLGNAIDAAGPGGSVEVVIKDEVGPGAGVFVLEVLDSGPGPPPELAERLFEPFVTSKPEGVGLGLAVARQVAEGHGGRVGWLRRDGRTCFHVTFPAAPRGSVNPH